MINVKRLKIVLIIGLVFVSYLIWSYSYAASTLSPTFFMRRLSLLVAVDTTVPLNWDNVAYKTIPAGASYLISISEVTGVSLRDATYYPTMILASVVSFYYLGQVLLQNRVHAILLATATTLYLYGASTGISEYKLGKALYPLFAGLIGAWWIKQDMRFAALAFPVLIAMKFLSPHAEVWGVGLLVFILLMMTIGEHVSGRTYVMQKQFAIYSVGAGIVFFAYNPKVYIQLLALRGARLFEFSFGSAASSPFMTSPTSPPISALLNTMFLSLAVITALSAAGWVVIKLARPGIPLSWNDMFTKRDCLAVAVFLGLLPDTIISGLIGRVTFQLATYSGVMACLYAVHRAEATPSGSLITQRLSHSFSRSFSQGSVTTVVGVILVTIALLSQAAFVAGDGGRPIGDHAANDAIAEYIAHSDGELVTDFDTYTLLRVNTAKLNSEPASAYRPNPVSADLVGYSDQTYRYLLGQANSPDRQFDLYLINHQTANYPVQEGGSWNYYHPPGQYNEQFQSNQQLSPIYSSGMYTVYANESVFDGSGG